MSRPRLRDLGIELGRLPTGPLNALTDVAGVRVGHSTRIDGAGGGAVNSGVTAVLPHGGDLYEERVPAAVAVLNGCGELFGREYVDEMGVLDTPIFLTGSFNVARVADAVITETARTHRHVGRGDAFVHPFVAECSDAYYSDLLARPVGLDETVAAWRSASDGPVGEGCVGAGTGLVSFQLKAGIGTASRLAQTAGDTFVVGALVSSNTGEREQLRVGGTSVGAALSVPKPTWTQEGSIVIVLATDAPLLPRQLRRLALRAHLGLARTGATAHDGSGDFAVAFSTANRFVRGAGVHPLQDIANAEMSPLFDAVVEATEEAVLNALCAAHGYVGRDGNFAPALPLDELVELVVNPLPTG